MYDKKKNYFIYLFIILIKEILLNIKLKKHINNLYNYIMGIGNGKLVFLR